MPAAIDVNRHPALIPIKGSRSAPIDTDVFGPAGKFSTVTLADAGIT